jgi:hypothetical protein
MIVNLAVENDDQISAVREDGLVPAFQIDNLQAHCAERDRVAFEYSLLVRPAVADAFNRVLQHARRTGIVDMGKARYSAHVVGTPRAGQVIENGDIAAASNRYIIAGNCSMH